MDLCLRHQVALLIVGPTGTGKSVYVNEKIVNGLGEEYMANPVTFSAQITASQTQVELFPQNFPNSQTSCFESLTLSCSFCFTFFYFLQPYLRLKWCMSPAADFLLLFCLTVFFLSFSSLWFYKLLWRRASQSTFGLLPSQIGLGHQPFRKERSRLLWSARWEKMCHLCWRHEHACHWNLWGTATNRTSSSVFWSQALVWFFLRSLE